MHPAKSIFANTVKPHDVAFNTPIMIATSIIFAGDNYDDSGGDDDHTMTILIMEPAANR